MNLAMNSRLEESNVYVKLAFHFLKLIVWWCSRGTPDTIFPKYIWMWSFYIFKSKLYEEEDFIVENSTNNTLS